MSCPYDSTIKVFDAQSMTRLDEWSVERPGVLAMDGGAGVLSPQPQAVVAGGNQDIGSWAELENAARQWVRIRNQLTIIMGPIFVANSDGIVSYEVIGENQVAVLTAFFKIVVDYKGPGQTEVLTFIIPNEKLTGRHYSEFLVSVNEVEAATGLDFLTALPEEEQATIEAERAREVWPLVAPPAEDGEDDDQ